VVFFNAILKVVFWCPSKEGFSFIFFYILFYVKIDFRGLGNDILYAKIDFREREMHFFATKHIFQASKVDFLKDRIFLSKSHHDSVIFLHF
jgi:hypothetical protein